MKSLTDARKIEAAKHYYESFSDNVITAAVINSYNPSIVDIHTTFGSVYIKITNNEISVHTDLGEHGCVELSKHIQS